MKDNKENKFAVHNVAEKTFFPHQDIPPQPRKYKLFKLDRYDYNYKQKTEVSESVNPLKRLDTQQDPQIYVSFTGSIDDTISTGINQDYDQNSFFTNSIERDNLQEQLRLMSGAKIYDPSVREYNNDWVLLILENQKLMQEKRNNNHFKTQPCLLESEVMQEKKFTQVLEFKRQPGVRQASDQKQVEITERTDRSTKNISLLDKLRKPDYQ